MSTETVKFSSYGEECSIIQQAIQQEFPNLQILDVHIDISGKGKGNIVIPFKEEEGSDLLPSKLIIPIRLDAEIQVASIIEKARCFCSAIFQTFSDLSVDLSNSSRPQWSNKPQP